MITEYWWQFDVHLLNRRKNIFKKNTFSASRQYHNCNNLSGLLKENLQTEQVTLIQVLWVLLGS